MKTVGQLAAFLMLAGLIGFAASLYFVSDPYQGTAIAKLCGLAIGWGMILAVVHAVLKFFDRRLPGRASPATPPRRPHADDTWPDIR